MTVAGYLLNNVDLRQLCSFDSFMIIHLSCVVSSRLPPPQGFVSISTAAPAAGASEAAQLLQSLFAGCIEQRKEAMEQSIVGE